MNVITINKLIVNGYDYLDDWNQLALDNYLIDENIKNKHVIISELLKITNNRDGIKAVELLKKLSNDRNNSIDLYYYDDNDYRALPVDLKELKNIYKLFYKKA